MGDAWNQAQGLDREALIHKYILVSAVVTPASWWNSCGQWEMPEKGAALDFRGWPVCFFS
jgi:hypothetical protein